MSYRNFDSKKEYVNMMIICFQLYLFLHINFYKKPLNNSTKPTRYQKKIIHNPRFNLKYTICWIFRAALKKSNAKIFKCRGFALKNPMSTIQRRAIICQKRKKIPKIVFFTQFCLWQIESKISYNHKNGQNNFQKRTFLRTKVLTRLICISLA